MYGDTPLASDELQEPSAYQPHVANHSFSHRLIVVANRLPVIASKDKEGNWKLQARPHTSDTVYLPPISPHCLFANLPQKSNATSLSQPSCCLRFSPVICLVCIERSKVFRELKVYLSTSL